MQFCIVCSFPEEGLGVFSGLSDVEGGLCVNSFMGGWGLFVVGACFERRVCVVRGVLVVLIWMEVDCSDLFVLIGTEIDEYYLMVRGRVHIACRIHSGLELRFVSVYRDRP